MTLAHNPLWPVVDPRARIEQITVQRLSPPVDRTVTPPAREPREYGGLRRFDWYCVIGGIVIAFLIGAFGLDMADYGLGDARNHVLAGVVGQ